MSNRLPQISQPVVDPKTNLMTTYWYRFFEVLGKLVTNADTPIPPTPVMLGDKGLGGTSGLVPAPNTGDAAKALLGDATWGSLDLATLTSSLTGSGYIKVGGILIQSGTLTFAQQKNSNVLTNTLTLPHAFSNTSYSVIASARFDNAATAYRVQVGAQTLSTTQVTFGSASASNADSFTGIDWIAWGA